MWFLIFSVGLSGWCALCSLFRLQATRRCSTDGKTREKTICSDFVCLSLSQLKPVLHTKFSPLCQSEKLNAAAKKTPIQVGIWNRIFGECHALMNFNWNMFFSRRVCLHFADLDLKQWKNWQTIFFFICMSFIIIIAYGDGGILWNWLLFQLW